MESMHSSNAYPVSVQDELSAFINKIKTRAPLRSAAPTSGSNSGGSDPGDAAGAAPALPGTGAAAAGTGT